MTDSMLPEEVLHAAQPLLLAAAEFVRAAQPHAPAELAAEFAQCDELVVSVRVHPTPALTISGSGARGLVKWDIALQPRLGALS